MKRLVQVCTWMVLLLMGTGWGMAQLPVIQTPVTTAPSVTIYVSPVGNDNNSGALSAPVATFQRAMQLIPFNGSDVYGEVVFLAGSYYPTQGLVQSVSDYEQGNSRKHISVRGQGTVDIYGDHTPNAQILLWLRGSKIKVENLRLHNSKNTGLLITNPDANGAYQVNRTIQDVIVKDVFVDSAFSHSILSKLVTRVLYENVVATNGQMENEGPNGNCMWGSAIRVDYGKDVTYRNCQSYHNRGEGINVAVCSNALVEGCTSYDNLAPNFYCIKSNNVIFRRNLAYNRDSVYWRNCVPGPSPSAPFPRAVTPGISIANEVAYDGPNNSCAAARTYDGGLFSNKIADSIFIYNNVFVMAGFLITDDSNGDCFFQNGHSNNFSNIFVENNTFIGQHTASPFQNGNSPVQLVLDQTLFHGCFPNIDGRGMCRFENLVWKNNIVSIKALNGSQPVTTTYVFYGGRPCSGGVLGDKVTSSMNLWHHAPPTVYDNYAITSVPNPWLGGTDLIRGQMPIDLDPSQGLEGICPDSNSSGTNYSLFRRAPVSSYIVDDFTGASRQQGLSNVGALETNCPVGLLAPVQETLAVYPNPSNGRFEVQMGAIHGAVGLHVVDILGREVDYRMTKAPDRLWVELVSPVPGIVVVVLDANGWRKSARVLISE